MSSDVKIPEWAVEAATELADEVFDACVDAYEGVPDAADYTAMLAHALLAAEQRGIERASPALAKAEQALKDWLHVYAPDLCKPEEVEAAENRIGEHGTIAYIADALAAIRSLGENT